MKNFIEQLYDYCKSHKSLPEVSLDNPNLNDVYTKAVVYRFEGTIVPTRLSELEDLAYFISEIIIDFSSGGLVYKDGICTNVNYLKFHSALCHCLAYVDYESARYAYDCDKTRDLNCFYNLCNQLGIKYRRFYFALEYDVNIMDSYIIGFRKEYRNLIAQDPPLRDNSCMTYDEDIILDKFYDLICIGKLREDWLANPILKEIWDKMPDGYIRNNYRDPDYYANISLDKKLPLLAIYLDILRVEAEDKKEIVNFSFIERSLHAKRFINRKLNEIYRPKFIKDKGIDLDTKYLKFLERWPDISVLVSIFPTYKSSIIQGIIKATEK